MLNHSEISNVWKDSYYFKWGKMGYLSQTIKNASRVSLSFLDCSLFVLLPTVQFQVRQTRYFLSLFLVIDDVC